MFFLVNQEPIGLLLGSLYPGTVSCNILVVGEGQVNNSPERNRSVNLSGEFLGPSSESQTCSRMLAVQTSAITSYWTITSLVGKSQLA